MKEMVGGCCVCSDERGWPENPLVYCDGQNCTVAVHQACYGIVTVPTGPWYCRKCESQERAARVRCELCPSRDGALKKTDNHGWAHVVCALYIPEVRFGNVTTMEPIILQLIPHERYAKTCYICQEIGKGSKAHVGACMQCNKAGCKQQFHVTCAQALGLLCEEAGNYLDNVKYCGYCQHHYSKLKKGGNVKTIPPYKPVTNEAGSSDPPSSPEKESESLPSSHHNTASTSASLKSIAGSGSSTSHPNHTQSSSSSSSVTTTTTSSTVPSGAHTSGSTSSATTSASSSSKLRKSGGSGGSSSKSSSGPSASAHLPSSSPNAQNSGSSSSHGNSSSSVRSQSSSSSSAKDKESKYNKNPSKTSSSKSHDKDARGEKSSKSSSSSKGSHKENASLSDPSTLLVPPIVVSTAMLNSSKDSVPTTMTTTKDAMAQKFTTSNFAETMVVHSESTFSGENATSSAKSSNSMVSNTPATGSSSSTINSTAGPMLSVAKKRKVDVTKLGSMNNDSEINKDLIKDVSVTLVPLPAMDRVELADEKNSKKQKTDSTPTVSPLRIVHEPNLQNVSPNLPHSSGSQKHPVIVGQSSGSSSGSTYSIQPAHSKLSNNDARHHTSSQPLSASINVSQNNSTSTQPSLVVSVPLSNVTVPGVNLPPNTSATIVQVNQQQQQQQQSQPYSTAAQQRLGGENIGQHRHSPNISSNNSNPQIQQQQQQQSQQHQSVLQNHHHSKGRHSPAVHPSSNSQYPLVPTSLPSSSPSSHSLANITPVPSDHCSPVSVLQSPAGGSTPMDTDTGGLKISYEKQPNSRIMQLQDDSMVGRRSRTPDNVYSANASSASANSSFGGLKFGYEAQTPSASIAATASSANVTPSVTPQPAAIKDSPPSSPGSEAGSARKRNRHSTDTKDFKIFQNGVHVTHMLGNQLNPNSSVAQKMSDQLHMELEAHSVYTSSSMDSASQLIGPPFPGKQQALNRANAAATSQSQGPPSLTSMLGGNGTPTAAGNTPQSLEQLLERQWEQGSQFLMEQAQHFDIASLLSCLHQLRTENVRLEDHVTNLVARRDHLLAVNARLAIPLNPPVPQTATQGNQFNNIHMNGPISEMSSHSVTGAPSNRSNNPNQSQPTQRSGVQHSYTQQPHSMQPQQQQQQQLQHQPMENGIDFRHGTTSGHPMSTGGVGSGGVPSSSRQSTSHIQPQQHLYSNQLNANSMVGSRQHSQHQPQSSHQQSSSHGGGGVSSAGLGNAGPTDPSQMRGRVGGSVSACATQQQQMPPTGYSNQLPSHQHQNNRRGDDGQVKPS